MSSSRSSSKRHSVCPPVVYAIVARAHHSISQCCSSSWHRCQASSFSPARFSPAACTSGRRCVLPAKICGSARYTCPSCLGQVSATLRAPWDTNWDNIVDNIRLAWSGKVQTGAVRLSDWRTLARCSHSWPPACRWPTTCWSTTTRTPTAGTFWTPPSRPTWCVRRMCASDVRRARFPCIVPGAGASAHTTLQRRLPIACRRAQAQLRRQADEPAAAAQLAHLRSDACSRAEASLAQRPVAWAAWCGLCGCAHRAAQWLELRAPAPPHPGPMPGPHLRPPSAAREVRELEVHELWHAGPRSPAARSSRRSTRAAACHRAVGRAFAFRLARAAARAPLLGLHPAALYHGIAIHPAASTMQAGAYARLCHPFGRTRAR